MSRALSALAAGLLFALGLGVSGMTDPKVVLSFLNLLGTWDPSLALVMVGAIGVHAIPAQIALRYPRPLLDVRFHTAPFTRVDAPLVVGSVLFGAGWGLAGYCPGPALVSAAAGRSEALLFVGAMIAGAGLHAFAQARGAAPDPDVVPVDLGAPVE